MDLFSAPFWGPFRVDVFPPVRSGPSGAAGTPHFTGEENAGRHASCQLGGPQAGIKTQKALNDDMIRDEDIPLRNPSVEAHRVTGGAVLHDLGRDQVFAVTALAREVWEHCDGNTPLQKIDRRVSDRADIPSPTSPDGLRQVVSHLSDQDLLFVHRPDPTADGGAAAGRGDQADGPGATTLNVVFGNHQVIVKTTAPRLERAVRRLFHGLIGRETGAETVDVLTAEEAGDGVSVRSPQARGGEARPLTAAVQRLKRTVLLRFMEARRDLIWLHAGAAARNGTAVLVAGPSGGGKSTTIADLCRSGWTHVSDDLTPYDPDTGRVVPLPVTIAYRQPGENQSLEEGPSGLPKTHVDLEAGRLQDAPVRPEAVFFPAFEADRPAGVEEQAAPEAAVSLVESCQNASRHRGEAVRELSRLAGRVSSFRLRHDGQTDIGELLAPVLG
ncbi:hypothetical protein [Salinibacter ruber]|uniref:Uncharacterized protein n=1 Tax=Salinibacter ruber TaxID=146919 RepID=A0A9X3A346_9BACT|nr:hypothetical protein [Salinibacter ruber]MBB4070466.1 hypothetical protein [Salinibacter ruber]MCS3856228.1 hypothetical protein [Salinibacter ruber]MCS3951629.1 hypothetical protein [Salinibacter ruber]MCS4047816.1 hypothetical protein [Salinibacter ruber]MCS4086187.1 hypothetical protein [Salinibacter ruber]